MPYISGRKKSESEGEDQQPDPRQKRPSKALDDIDIIRLQKAYDELGDVHRQVREAHIEMIFNLAIAAEYKDPDTGNHILRISDYSVEIASMMGLPSEQIEHLRYAAPMHDIGKIGIPDKILQKPGKLAPDEWVLMKQHTVIGARMFQSSKSELLKTAADIAISHHEKFDGSGYPHGLKGTDIPMSGRIIAVADIFDAIVSKRCYKPANSFGEGMAYIESLAGGHLDPDIVRHFLKNEARVRKIYDANAKIQEFIAGAGSELHGAKQDIEI